MDLWLDTFAWPHITAETSIKDEELLISPKWLEFLKLTPYLRKRLKSLITEVSKLRNISVIYPPQELIMKWSYECDPESIKVIILGQDPYPQGQATGLAFSVFRDKPIPASLQNIFQEVKTCFPETKVLHGCLDSWAKQGVLLLNTTFTVERGKPGSHFNLGWAWLTNFIITSLSDKLHNCVFLLWGSKAISKAALINHQKHLVLKAQHPSPLAASNSRPRAWPKFLGCQHFKLANDYLVSHEQAPINWSVV